MRVVGTSLGDLAGTGVEEDAARATSSDVWLEFERVIRLDTVERAEERRGEHINIEQHQVRLVVQVVDPRFKSSLVTAFMLCVMDSHSSAFQGIVIRTRVASPSIILRFDLSRMCGMCKDGGYDAVRVSEYLSRVDRS